MNQDLLLRAAKLNKLHHRKDRVHRAARFLSFVIVLCTVWSLMLPAVTLNGEVVCGLEEHTHGDGCYETRTIPACGLEESEGHTHTDSCYTETEEYVCGLEESEGHAHTDACYTEERTLSCGQEESVGHTHTDECFKETLICDIRDEDHTHDESCYTKELNCELEETEGHTHTDACYTTEAVLNCGLEESAAHTHTDACLGAVKTLVCEIPEAEGHTHSDACGTTEEQVLVCEKPEHTHTDECYPEASDNSADTETAAYWESTFANVTLTGNYADDVLAIAETQLGYHESTKNFQYVGSLKKGYTRYGAWYGDPYGDWCAMFVSFCMRYAGVPESVIPSSSVCNSWTVLLDQLGRFEKAGDYTPRPGDVIFFDTDGEGGLNATHVGLVAWVGETTLGTIEGNAGDCVCTNEYSLDSAVIYGYGRLGDKVDETVLTYTDSNINAELTVSPALDGEAELQIEKLDPAEDETLWKNMAAPVAEQMIEDKDEPETLDLYRFSLLKNGEPLELTEDYALTLDATVPAPVTDGEREEPSESVQSFALSVLTEEELKALEEQEEAEQLQREDEEEIDPVEVLLTALMPETEEKQEVINEEEKPLPALKAMKLAQSPTDDPDHAELSFDGDGMFYGFALASMPEAALLSAPEDMEEVVPLGDTSETFTPTANVASHKQIDYLYNNGDEYKTVEYQDKYCLHLDAGELEYAEPIDLLIVVDRSQSMSDPIETGSTTRRDDTVTKILNGSTESVTDDGLISKFLALHPQNKVAVVSFFGDHSTGADEVPNFDYNTDTGDPLLNWTTASQWKDHERVSCTAQTELSCTDYCAAYLKMSEMLKASGISDDGHKKMVIFLSDGVPTYYLVKEENESYTRKGNGIPTDDDNVAANETETKNRFLDMFNVESAPVFTIGIGFGEGTSTAVLEYMSTQTGGKYFPANNAADLANNFEKIVYGNAGQMTKLEITDTLSEYVSMSGNITVKAGEKTLYSLDAVPAEGVNETTEAAGVSGSFTADNTYTTASGSEVPLLKSVSYDSASKTITVLFNEDAVLDVGMKYELAFDVELTAAAALKYKMSGYNAEGAANTDYGNNATSSGKKGFYSNIEATVSYSYDGADATPVILPKPVVQAVEEGGGSTPYTAHGYITQHKTIDWLGDKSDTKRQGKYTDLGNTDTDLDDQVSAEGMKDFYRLYLDAGQMTVSEPVDLLFIVDRSGSMGQSAGSMNRDKVVMNILNGTTSTSSTADISNGLISKVLAMNPANKVAVTWFGGDPNKSSGSNDAGELLNWTQTASLVNCSSQNHGTNYNAGMIKAHDMLEKSYNETPIKTDGVRKLVIFLSDGRPTYASSVTNDWKLNGTRTGDGSEKTNNLNAVKSPTQTVITKFHNYLKTFVTTEDNTNQVSVYTIGIGDFDTEMMQKINYGGATYTGNDYNSLLSIIQNIIYGETGAFRALSITDTLSDYVDLYETNADIKVTMSSGSTTKTLYERGAASGTFSDSTTQAGKNGYFTANNSYTPATEGSTPMPLLSNVSYDSETKTFMVTFNENVDLDRSIKYELSYNVNVTEAAKKEYLENKAETRDGYGGMKGDAATDFKINDTSSEKGGFRSNAGAAAAYMLGSVRYDIPYDHPVVQVEAKETPPTLEITVEQQWPEGEPPAGTEVTVMLYQTTDTGDSKKLTLSKKNGVPVTYTLTADKEWTQTVTGLPLKDESGEDLTYFIIAEPLDGYYSTYDDPKSSNTLADKPVVSGAVKITPPEEGSLISTGLAIVSSTPGVILPDTGGSGTALFTGFGLALLALGAALAAKQTRTYKRERNMNIKGKVTMKKALALLMTLVMVFALGVTAFADEAPKHTQPGTITVKNASKGVTYTLYKIFDAEVYEFNKDAVLYKAGSYTGGTYFGVNADGYIVENTGARDANGKLTEGAIEELAALANDGNKIESVAGTGDEIKFSDLVFGYYYLTTALGSAVSIDTNNESIVIYDKNTVYPTWHSENPADANAPIGKTILVDGKNVESEDFNIGDVVTFQTKIDTVAYVGKDKVSSYCIDDVMPEGLKFLELKSITVGDKTLTSEDYYKETTDAGFKIKVPWMGKESPFITRYDHGSILTVEYTALVTDAAKIAGTGNINTSSFNYKLHRDGATKRTDNFYIVEDLSKCDGETLSDTATVFTYALALVKVDSKTGEKLMGAEFTLPFYVKPLAGNNDEYIVCPEDATGATNKVTTNRVGYITIKGLEAGTYHIEESKAPKGYNRPDAFDVEVEATDATSTHSVTYLDGNGGISEAATTTAVTYDNTYFAASVSVILNVRGNVLPTTGGMGTTLFYIVGGLLVFGAALLLITKKRMKAEK